MSSPSEESWGFNDMYPDDDTLSESLAGAAR